MTSISTPIPARKDAQAPEPRAEAKTQYGALCWRPSPEKKHAGEVEVLLITSRDTGRWVIPKGWPIRDLSPEASAAREAWEEAGVEGRADPHCLGLYSYDKGIGPERHPLPCVVAVYGLRVAQLADRFPERKQRRRKWFRPDEAARRVAEPELQALLASLADWNGKQGKPAAEQRKTAPAPDVADSRPPATATASRGKNRRNG